ncbi:class II aldolase/adducin family protein [Paucisalibacillus sp. EB02]|uniref:class II aldolase/adducin family protein n=1 Tax=Paucisalibacillus sp. EB02 TaxID=1347087 RepID=UPI0004B1A84D|nr:class II aldolase/adducin family protein [Paucisalibacillus sp. EB02]
MTFKLEVVHFAKKCYNSGLTVGTSGNVSVRDGNLMYITPSALPYDEMTEEDVLVVDLTSGDIVEGARNPSSETPMHSNIYYGNPNVEAIVHTHSKFATMFACAHMPIPPVHYTIADIGREVPVAPYARYGSEKLAKYAVETLEKNQTNGVLLANHGVVAVGSTLDDAYRRAETIEEVAELAYGSKLLSEFKLLTDEELDEALEGFKTYVSN